MKRWHNDKDDVSEDGDFDEEAEFSAEGLTYDVNFDDLLSDLKDDEEEPWNGGSHYQAQARLRRMRDIPVAHDDSGDEWDDEDW